MWYHYSIKIKEGHQPNGGLLRQPSLKEIAVKINFHRKHFTVTRHGRKERLSYKEAAKGAVGLAKLICKAFKPLPKDYEL